MIGDGCVDDDVDGKMGILLHRPAGLRSDWTIGSPLQPTAPGNRSVDDMMKPPPRLTDPVNLSKLTNADVTLKTVTRGNVNNIYHGGGGMRWHEVAEGRWW